MNIEITGRQVDITPALRDFTEDKLRKLERLLSGPLEAHVVLAISKHRHSAEIQVKSPHVTLTGTEETGDLYTSIGEVVDKLERQALKHKEKTRDHKHRKGIRDPEIAAALEATVAQQATVEAPEPPLSPRIVRSQRYRLKPMSAEDAVLELEGSTDDLLVFRDGQTNRINVVYRQRNGDYALIDPDF